MVQKTGAVNPGNTSPVTALCPSTYTAISWGFQAITLTQGRPTSLELVSAQPFKRVNGAIAGWTARFRNPHQIPLGVRLGATCAEGRGGVEIRTAGQRSLAAPAAAIELYTVTASAEPGSDGTADVTALCRKGGVPITAGYDLGRSRLVTTTPIRVDGSLGWVARARFDEPGAGMEPVALELVCGEGRGVTLGLKGLGLGPPTSQLVVDATGTHRLVLAAPTTSFFFECRKGVNLGIAFGPAADTPGAVPDPPPLVGAWLHRSVTQGKQTLNPKARTIAFLHDGFHVAYDLRALCLTGDKLLERLNKGFVEVIL